MLTELCPKLEKAIQKHKNIPLKYLLKFFFFLRKAITAVLIMPVPKLSQVTQSTFELNKGIKNKHSCSGPPAFRSGSCRLSFS